MGEIDKSDSMPPRGFWIKGGPLPEGSEDLEIAGLIEFSDGEIRAGFEDEVPEHIQQKAENLPDNSIIEVIQ